MTCTEDWDFVLSMLTGDTSLHTGVLIVLETVVRQLGRGWREGSSFNVSFIQGKLRILC